MGKNKKLLSVFLVLALIAAFVCFASISSNASVDVDGVEHYIIGDVDLNDDVTINDATNLQKYLAKQEILIKLQLLLADTDGDGDVTINDVTTIQKHLAKLSDMGVVGELITAPDEDSTPDQTTTEKVTETADKTSNVSDIPTTTIVIASSKTETTTKIITESSTVIIPITTTVPVTTTIPVTTTVPITTTIPEPTTGPYDFEKVREPEIPYATSNALYAHGVSPVAEEDSFKEEGWAKWESYNSNYYFFVPVSTKSGVVEIYNSYPEDANINGTVIFSKTSRCISYTEGIALTVKIGSGQTRYLYIKRSLAEGALYYNTQNSKYQYDSSEFNKVNSDPYKNYTAIGKYTIADRNGYVQTGSVSKFKGRGNTTWGKEKKPYNITFEDAINMDNLVNGKKFTLLANYQDATNTRNRLLYDMAHEMDLPYSPGSQFVDFYVNGVYNGSYQLTDKIEMGSNDLISLKNNMSSSQTSNFNFVIELVSPEEIYVTSSRKNYGVLKDPSPDAATTEGKAQLKFISDKFQELEDALYSKDLKQLAAIADVESFAKMYIINEFSKNVDGGYSSTFFSYVADEDKFIATPVWDFDCALGNLYDATASKPIALPTDLYTKLMGSIRREHANFLGLFVKMNGAEYLVKQIYEEHMPEIMDVLSGKTESKNGRLQSMAEYKNLLTKMMELNYMRWPFPSNNNGFTWIPDQTRLSFINANLTTTTKYYSENFSGSFDFMYDWAISRHNWLMDYYSKVTEDGNPDEDDEDEAGFYIAGTEELTGINFSPNDSNNKMQFVSSGIYEITYIVDPVSPQQTGYETVYPYRFRITDGTYNNTWGYSNVVGVSFPTGISINTSGLNNTINFNYNGAVACDKIELTITFKSWTGEISLKAKYITN